MRLNSAESHLFISDRSTRLRVKWGAEKHSQAQDGHGASSRTPIPVTHTPNSASEQSKSFHQEGKLSSIVKKQVYASS